MSWGCSFSLVLPPPVTCSGLFPQCVSEPALFSLLPWPSPHLTWLLHHLLTGDSVSSVALLCPIHPATLTTLKAHNTSLLCSKILNVSTNTRVRPLQIQPPPSSPNDLVCSLSFSKTGCHFTFIPAEFPSPEVLPHHSQHWEGHNFI